MSSSTTSRPITYKKRGHRNGAAVCGCVVVLGKNTIRLSNRSRRMRGLIGGDSVDVVDVVDDDVQIYFLLVRIKIKHMEMAIIRRETAGSGSNQYNENETIVKYEVMDGAPAKGEGRQKQN